MNMGKKFVAIFVGLTALGLVSCSSPPTKAAAPTYTAPLFPEPAPTESVDWEALNQEEINDPAPMANSTKGPYGYHQVEIRGAAYSVISVSQQSTVDLVDKSTGKKDGTYGPNRRGVFYKVEVGVENLSASSQNDFDQPRLWALDSTPRVCLESKGNILLACVEEWSPLVGELWNDAQRIPPGEDSTADYFFDVPGRQVPAYLTFFAYGQQKTILGGKIPLLAPVDRIRLAE